MSSFRTKLGPPGPIFFHWTTEALIYNIPCPSPHPSHPSKLFGTLTKIMSPTVTRLDVIFSYPDRVPLTHFVHRAKKVFALWA